MEKLLIAPYKARDTALRCRTYCDLSLIFALRLSDSSLDRKATRLARVMPYPSAQMPSAISSIAVRARVGVRV
jgi:hypothetical protein